MCSPVLAFSCAAICLASIVIAYCYEVLVRYFFNAPTSWASALASYALCGSCYSTTPELTRKNIHIVINVLTDRMPARQAAYLQWLVTLACAATCLFVAWVVGTMAVTQYKQGIETILNWPVRKWPLTSVIAYGFLSAGIYFIRHLVSGAPASSLGTGSGSVMSWWLILSAGIALLLSLFLLGVPIFVAFVVLNVAGMVFFGLPGSACSPTASIRPRRSGALAAVPLFIVMGEILFRSGAMEVLFDSLDRLIGRIRGRQYVLCIVLSAILGALSGAAMAVAGLLGRSLFPTMRERGYDTQFSAGTILAGASLDPIIPPSVLAVIIATLADVSAGKMLIAGIIPGLLLTGMFLVYVHRARVRLEPSLAPDIAAEVGRPQARQPLMALVRMLPSGFVFFMVMGLIMLGVATPTEAAATGVFGASCWPAFYGGLSRKMLTEALCSAATVASLLLVIMCCAVMFSQLLTFTARRRALGEFVVGLELPAALMLFAMMALPFVLFMFLDQVALMLVLIPIYQPILKIYDFDPIWFWTLFLVSRRSAASRRRLATCCSRSRAPRPTCR